MGKLLTELSMPSPKERFDVLDGIRGVAAIAVMIHHFSFHDPAPLFSGAFTAVDIFFILSGFVVAHSYGEKIKNGMSFARFSLLRLIRLYPLFLVGLSVGLIAVLVQADKYENPALFFTKVGQAFALNLFMIPYFGDLSILYDRETLKGVAFPSNNVLWSLFFELFVSLAFFAYVKGFKKIYSIALAVLGIALFFVVGFHIGQPNPGWGASNFIGGFPRVIGEFALGTVIYVNRHRIGQTSPWLFAGLSVVVLVSFFLRFKGSWMIYDLLVYPVFILLASRLSVEGITKSISSYLGKLSYPLYIIHLPIYMIAYEMTSISVLSPALRLVITCTISLLAAAILYKIDEKFRSKFLNFILPRKIII